MAGSATHRAIDAVWRIESPRLIAGLARMVRDVGFAEDLAQDALVTALERWPESGVPDNPGAWLMATAKNRAIDQLRRSARLQGKQEELAREVELQLREAPEDVDAALDDQVGDDLLSLVFTTCHPVLSPDARCALTLRLLGGLTTDEIARAFLVPSPTVGQRISRAKKTLAEANVPFEVPRGPELQARLSSVLDVIYLIFNEGYAATAGDDWMRPALCEDALRLGRIVAGLIPREPEVHGLVALMEIQASRARADGAGRRADPAARSGPRPLGPAADGARDRRARARRTARRRVRPLRAAGRDRGLPRTGAHGRGDRLGADLRAVRRAGPARPLAGRRAQPGGRGVDGLRPRARPGDRRRAGRRAGAEELPPPAERARRPAREARAHRGGARGVRARGVADAERARARAAARARERLRVSSAGFPQPDPASHRMEVRARPVSLGSCPSGSSAARWPCSRSRPWAPRRRPGAPRSRPRSGCASTGACGASTRGSSSRARAT
ncbi:MAG: RNA polymerase sigma factor [Solirubrobacteraceae bacterium]